MAGSKRYAYTYDRTCVKCNKEFVSSKPFTKKCKECVFLVLSASKVKTKTSIFKKRRTFQERQELNLLKIKNRENRILTLAEQEGIKYKKLLLLAEQCNSKTEVGYCLGVSRERARQLLKKHNIVLKVKQNKKCPVCSKDFFTKSKGKTFCSKDCFYLSRQKRLLEQAEENRIKRVERQKSFRLKNPEKIKLYKERQKNKPDFNLKNAARTAVAVAIKKGILVRPDVCSFCNKQKNKIEAHHQDYNKQLDVIWLCKPCHGAHDSLLK